MAFQSDFRVTARIGLNHPVISWIADLGPQNAGPSRVDLPQREVYVNSRLTEAMRTLRTLRTLKALISFYIYILFSLLPFSLDNTLILTLRVRRGIKRIVRGVVSSVCACGPWSNDEGPQGTAGSAATMNINTRSPAREYNTACLTSADINSIFKVVYRVDPPSPRLLPSNSCISDFTPLTNFSLFVRMPI